MTAHTRARFRAPWLALPLAIALLLGATPAVADEQPDATVPVEQAPADPAPAEQAPVEPVPADPAPAEPGPSDPAPVEQEPAEQEPAEQGPGEQAPADPAHPEPAAADQAPAARSASAAAASVTPAFSVSPSTGVDDGDTVTVTVTLPATVPANTGTDLVTGVYVMYCVQPSGAVGTSAGRASGAQCDASRQHYLVASAGPAGGTVAGTITDGAWTFSVPLTVADAFGAHECLAASPTATEQCGVFLRLYHGFNAGNVANPYLYDTFLPVTFAAPPPAYTPGITVSPQTGLDDGDVVTVTGALPAAITSTANAPLTTGVYLMYCVQPSGAAGTPAGRATGADCDATRQLYLVASAGPAGGTVAGSVTAGVWNFTATLPVTDAVGAHECLAASTTATAQCGVFVRLYHGFHAGNVADPYRFDQFVPVTFAAPQTPGTPGGNPGTPGTPNTPGASPRLAVTPSTIDPSAATTVTIRGTGYTGAGAANGVYVNIGSSSVWQPGRTPSQGGWTVSGWVPPGALSGGAFSTTLRVPAGALTPGGSYGVATFAAHALALTNRSLDAWAPLTLGAPGSARDGDETDAAHTPASRPPSDEGIDLEQTALREGGVVSATAAGFEPGESGILVVLYSDPVVLDNDATADSDGVVHWSGRLPGGVTGSHTLTFQGSVDVGAPVEIAPRTALTCTVDDARLTWGFKESFRSYLSGSIANGEWTTAGDAGYETPEFFFDGGAGDRDEDAGTTVVQFAGSIRFTGHDGALDVTIAEPRIEASADSAVLILDVTGTTQDGRDIVRAAVPFADLDLTQVQPVTTDGVIRLAEIPATLTAEGADAFGTYAPGEALDPVTLTLPDGGCGAPADPVAASVDRPAAAAAVWPIWLAGSVLLVLAAIAAGIVLRRRRA